MTVELTNDDLGKEVTSGSERIGVVATVDVNDGVAYVTPDWDHVPDDLRETLDWTAGEDDQPLDESALSASVNDQLRLREDL